MGNGLTYKSLVDATEMIRTNSQPRVVKFNCNDFTANWIKETFASKESPTPANIFGNNFFGTPVFIVEYLAPGFIEVEKDDGSREIVDLRPKQEEGEVVR